MILDFMSECLIFIVRELTGAGSFMNNLSPLLSFQKSFSSLGLIFRDVAMTYFEMLDRYRTQLCGFKSNIKTD